MYLSAADRARLERLARSEGKSQAEVIRAALVHYAKSSVPDRRFALEGVGSFGGDAARLSEEESLRGFGDDPGH